MLEAHGLLYHSTLCLRVINKKKKVQGSGFSVQGSGVSVQGPGFRFQGPELRVWGGDCGAAPSDACVVCLGLSGRREIIPRPGVLIQHVSASNLRGFISHNGSIK